jgi:hypothetical protein
MSGKRNNTREHNKSICRAQNSFYVPISFAQELAHKDGEDNLIPLSLITENPEKVHGLLKLRFNNSMSVATYKLYVFNSEYNKNRIIGAHLQSGSANQNGLGIAELYNGFPTNSNGFLSKGYITNRDIHNIQGSVVNSVSALYQAILQGNVYVNVMTELYPAGFIRGQIYLH